MTYVTARRYELRREKQVPLPKEVPLEEESSSDTH
jgi:hypothetical protein